MTTYPTNRRVRNIPKLIEAYRLMKKYIEDNDGTLPSIADLVGMGVSPSTSVVRYYKKQMRNLGMIRFKDRISRSLTLLPLNEADEQVREYLEQETI